MFAMSVSEKQKGLVKGIRKAFLHTLAPIYPITHTGPVTSRFPIRQATTASPGLRPSATALDGTCICAALNPSATQNPPTWYHSHFFCEEGTGSKSLLLQREESPSAVNEPGGGHRTKWSSWKALNEFMIALFQSRDCGVAN